MNNSVIKGLEGRKAEIVKRVAEIRAIPNSDFTEDTIKEVNELDAEVRAIDDKLQTLADFMVEELVVGQPEERAEEEAENVEETKVEEKETEERSEEIMTQNTNFRDFDAENTPEVRAEKKANARRELRAYLAGENRSNESTVANNAGKAIEISKDIIDTIAETSKVVDKVSKIYSKGDYKQIKAKSAKKQTAYWTSEASSATTVESQWDSITIGHNKLTALAVVTLENFYQSDFDVLAEVERQQRDDIAKKVETAIFQGTGSGQPSGLTTGGTTLTLASDSAITADEVISIYHKLNSNYLNDSAWYMARGTLEAIRKLKDSDNQYLFHQNTTLEGGYTGLLLGKPVYVTEGIAGLGYNTTTNAGNKCIIFGDVNRGYKANVSPETTYQILTERYADIGCIGVMSIMWIDGKVVNDEAYVTVKNADHTSE